MMSAEHIRMPLVVPGTRPELAEVEGRIMAERGRISLLYQVLLNSGPIASGWERMLSAVRNQTEVPAHLRELAILRVAVLNGAIFEFDAHVPHAQRAGVTDEKIEATRLPVSGAQFDALELLVLELTDRMTRDIVVPDDLMKHLRKHFDAKGIVELVATVAAYNMVSRLLVALNVGHRTTCGMTTLWLKDFDVPFPNGRIDSTSGSHLSIWHAIDGSLTRAYLIATAAPDATWLGLEPLKSLAGASNGEQPLFHYVVETDVDATDEAEFNAWYDEEHLPGLASVPGTVRAARFRRLGGSPQYLACYDLVSSATLERPEWLAVRHTDWSARVRPLFRNTRRTMFRLAVPSNSFPRP